MKKYFLFLSLLVLVSVQSALASLRCEDLMVASRAKVGPKFFSPTGLKTFKSRVSGREMVYDFKAGTKDKVFVVIHGLGDDMTKMEALTELAEKDGYTVLRVDLHGHGRTLKKYLTKNNDSLPDKLDYADNITDLAELIDSLKLAKTLNRDNVDLVLVGHSYGGGIVYGLAAALEAQAGPSRNRVKSVHMLAPYVQRIDKFLTDYFKSPEFLIDKTVETMEKSGLPSNYVKSIMDPLFTMVWSMTSHIKFTRAYINKLMKIENTKDFLLDPWVEAFMKKSYRKYFILAAKKPESEMTEAELKEIDLKVEASIKVTKGIRTFDLLDQATPLIRVNAYVQIIGGKKDPLVLPGQLNDFDRRLISENLPHELRFVEGENSHHLFPRLMAVESYKMILEVAENPDPAQR